MHDIVLNRCWNNLQVARETEVKALIKLRFRTYRGEPIVVIRTFQVCWLGMGAAVIVRNCTQSDGVYAASNGMEMLSQWKPSMMSGCASADRHFSTLIMLTAFALGSATTWML